MTAVEMCQFSVFCITVYLLVTCVQAMIPSVPDYFPEIQGDLTAVTWAHAVNSQAKLHTALEDHVMMLEADVVLGTLEGEEVLQPIMAHPPNTTSDLSLAMFLEGVAGHRSGIKLDFKSSDVLLAALQLLQETQMTFPVMLNADILPGPVNSTVKPVDAHTFLQKCKELFPESTLSVGWTTRYGGNVTTGAYSLHNVEEMVRVLEEHVVTQPITFPVRAGLVANSNDVLTKLKESIANCTFTIWSSEGDPVDVPPLRSFILDTVGRDRVFVDVPPALAQELNLHPRSPQAFQSAASIVTFSIITLALWLIL